MLPTFSALGTKKEMTQMKLNRMIIFVIDTPSVTKIDTEHNDRVT